jgi:hypothetical protein
MLLHMCLLSTSTALELTQTNQPSRFEDVTQTMQLRLGITFYGTIDYQLQIFFDAINEQTSLE